MHPTDQLHREQDPSTSGPFELRRDGKVVITGTERECWQWIHSNTSHSVSWAIQYEGYAIAPTQTGVSQ